MNRWAIYIDIEGTSKIYPTHQGQFYSAFDALLSTVCEIRRKVFPESPSRIFPHQVGGDGIVIVSEFAEGLPETPISLAVVLLQVLLTKGLVGKAGISEGTFGDVKGCFPSLRSIPVGEGLLTMFPVMGTALINSHFYASCLPRGCRLALDPILFDACPQSVIVTKRDSKIIIVDWVHTTTDTMYQIVEKASVELLPSTILEALLVKYVANTGDLAKEDWGANSLSLNGCKTL